MFVREGRKCYQIGDLSSVFGFSELVCCVHVFPKSEMCGRIINRVINVLTG